ncbi:hypothetical protein U1Q18_002750 [Sarracenia purpurea var. burkii]
MFSNGKVIHLALPQPIQGEQKVRKGEKWRVQTLSSARSGNRGPLRFWELVSRELSAVAGAITITCLMLISLFERDLFILLFLLSGPQRFWDLVSRELSAVAGAITITCLMVRLLFVHV